MPGPLFGKQSGPDFGHRQFRTLQVVADQCRIEPLAIAFAHEQFDNDRGVQVHGLPAASVSILTDHFLG